MNEIQASYSARADAVLFIGTNQPGEITDAKSESFGIDRYSSNRRENSTRHYNTLLDEILRARAPLSSLSDGIFVNGQNHYNGYRPLEMMLQTDIFFNFIEAYDIFKQQTTPLKQAYGLYKEYCDETGIERPLPMYKIRKSCEITSTTSKIEEVEGNCSQFIFRFNAEKFKAPKLDDDLPAFSLVVRRRNHSSTPSSRTARPGWPKQRFQQKWANVKKKLLDIDTSSFYVKVPKKLIVIDDLKETNGHPSRANLEAQVVVQRMQSSQSGKGPSPLLLRR
jgi:hypothetical protein